MAQEYRSSNASGYSAGLSVLVPPTVQRGVALGLAIVSSAAARLNATIGFGEVRHGTAIILTFFKELVGEQRHPAIEAYVISNGELIAP